MCVCMYIVTIYNYLIYKKEIYKILNFRLLHAKKHIFEAPFFTIENKNTDYVRS